MCSSHDACISRSIHYFILIAALSGRLFPAYSLVDRGAEWRQAIFCGRVDRFGQRFAFLTAELLQGLKTDWETHSFYHREGTGKLGGREWHIGTRRRRSAGICLGRARFFGSFFGPQISGVIKVGFLWETAAVTNQMRAPLSSHVHLCVNRGLPKVKATKQRFPNCLACAQRPSQAWLGSFSPNSQPLPPSLPMER